MTSVDCDSRFFRIEGGLSKVLCDLVLLKWMVGIWIAVKVAFLTLLFFR